MAWPIEVKERAKALFAAGNKLAQVQKAMPDVGRITLWDWLQELKRELPEHEIYQQKAREIARANILDSLLLEHIKLQDAFADPSKVSLTELNIIAGTLIDKELRIQDMEARSNRDESLEALLRQADEVEAELRIKLNIPASPWHNRIVEGRISDGSDPDSEG